MWTPGEAGAQARLRRFLEDERDGVHAYDEMRNLPDRDGTSLLSPWLHFGELSPRQIWAAVRACSRESGVFPPMVISMVDVGEQTGALPEMLLKIADNYDEEVDNAVAAMTSLLEPIMIVFLAVIVGSIVIALFLPLITLIDKLGGSEGEGG